MGEFKESVEILLKPILEKYKDKKVALDTDINNFLNVLVDMECCDDDSFQKACEITLNCV